MGRSDRDPTAHPALELLAARATGLLPAEAAARVDAHVVDCALCRLEMARASRFHALEQDEEAAAQAGWEAAVPRLDAAWRTHIRPAVAPRRPRTLRWLVPLASAAALLLVAVIAGERNWRSVGVPGADSVRGPSAGAPVIQPQEPKGELTAVPTRFAWASSRQFDAFALEVFTGELDTVLRLTNLQTPHADLPDSLRRRLLTGTTYFWHVEGWKGLTATEASPTVSFRIVPAEK